ncbi:cytochrome c biogenesis heme-transporting ATPase CcmA [Rheinheimera sp. 1928-s]|uniref:cytochrome c biogenesis heme-transporting ATPase CcmA n=1 Tax=Rheinheimera sp. 1928-s TaxID=3033803 RepID=UPI002621DB55|nr:cytochrome c biogenesis heme-transporting ATPase CcmA [Rheinheimera sp. 1928-s]MDF3125653.1 cytochrome c biogenesis heme-transporting ATPase CcmA [Rheinheimera sp. 1928-s]
MSIILAAEALSCVRQDRVLFENLNFQLSAGQVLYIQGKNGAGKSSLLRLLAGLSLPEDGQILFHGKPLSSVAELFAEQLLFIGHQSGIHPQLTALQNLAFWSALTEQQVADPYQLLGFLGLAGLEDIPCFMLSAGQQRRVSLARLWFTTKPLWILDEPFTSLDQQLIAKLEQHFLQHLSAGGVIVLTSHQVLSASYPQLQAIELEYRW